jgi:hypothetical protein
VTLDWLGSASTCRKQETTFDMAYSTIHSYRMWGLKAIILALHSLIKLPAKVPKKFKHRYPYFDQALCAIDGAHFPIMSAAADTERFRNRKSRLL